LRAAIRRSAPPRGGEDHEHAGNHDGHRRQQGRIEGAWSPVRPEDTVPNALAALA